MTNPKNLESARQRLTAQILVYTLLGIAAAAVFGLWLNSSFDILFSGATGGFIAIGQLLGLAATLAVLLQFMLMGRIKWVEGPFGLDRIAHFHRLNGYVVILLISLHPLFLTIGYSLSGKVNLVAQYLTFITSFAYVWLALIAQLLLFGVAATSVYIVRKRLKFESWYYVHLLVYASIALAFWHQINVGGSFVSHPASRILWISLYAFVFANVAYWRIAKVIIDYLRFGFKVQKVVREADGISSIYISVKGLNQWKSKPGQFILVRFLTKELLWQEHPFSLSAIPAGGCLRITVKDVGSYTQTLQKLKSGTRVMVSGPFGSFTSDTATRPKKLFVAGGIGVTPLLALAQAAGKESDSVFIYSVKTADQAVLTVEIKAALSQNSLHIITSMEAGSGKAPKRVSADLIESLVPDYKNRDLFLCGPPPMMNSIIEQLEDKAFPLSQLHYERFSLHKKG